jgi:hypothetical protein
MEEIRMNAKSVKIYILYEIDEHNHPKFRGRFASRHRLKAAAMYMSNWFYEVEEKQDEFGGTIQLSA